SGETGEIVCRGPNVMAGYANDPEANAQVFRNGWLRTGDQGYLDEDGHLYMTGRLKETINRGGEKISPSEIDRVLETHEAVARAACFGIPHPSFGEDIAAAIVVRPGYRVTSAEIRRFAGAQLAASKLPRRIVFVPVIPAGPTGKFQRSKLAGQLGLLD